MLKSKIILLSILLFIFIKCSENTSLSDEIGDNFKLSINVKNNNSTPLSNIAISVWNKIIFNNYYLPKTNSNNEIQSASSIEFTLPMTSNVNLSIFDMEDKLYKSLISNELLAPGKYRVQFVPNKDVGTSVFKCKIITNTDSTSNDIIFRDSVYAVLIAPDPEIAKIGSTNQLGQFETENKLLFPNLYDLPDFIHTSEVSSDSLNSFSLSDEIIITLTNNNSEMKFFTKTISEKENIFELIWEEGSDEYPDWGWRAIFPKNNDLSKILDDSSAVIPNEYKLYQNYPNPFN